jgi:hypothetical protein
VDASAVLPLAPTVARPSRRASGEPVCRPSTALVPGRLRARGRAIAIPAVARAADRHPRAASVTAELSPSARQRTRPTGGSTGAVPGGRITDQLGVTFPIGRAASELRGPRRQSGAPSLPGGAESLPASHAAVDPFLPASDRGGTLLPPRVTPEGNEQEGRKRPLARKGGRRPPKETPGPLLASTPVAFLASVQASPIQWSRMLASSPRLARKSRETSRS